MRSVCGFAREFGPCPVVSIPGEHAEREAGLVVVDAVSACPFRKASIRCSQGSSLSNMPLATEDAEVVPVNQRQKLRGHGPRANAQVD
eukprot:7102107-Lingulodinium_polyedra.AAC.1